MSTMSGHIHLTDDERYEAREHPSGGAYVSVGLGILAIHGTGAQLFSLATALLDAVNLCPPFPDPVCGDIDEDDRCTRAPGHAGSHGNGVAAWEHFPTRDGDDLADWIDPIVKGAVQS